MGVLVVGECRGVISREAGPNRAGETWEEKTIVVDGHGLSRDYVTVASIEKFRGTLPAEGDVVALDCKVDMFLRKTGEPGHRLITFGRSAIVEAAVTAPAGK